MDFCKISQGVLKEALTALTKFFMEKRQLRPYKADLKSAELIDIGQIPKNLSDSDWTEHVLETVQGKGPSAIRTFFEIFLEDDWIMDVIGRTIKDVQRKQKCEGRSIEIKLQDKEYVTRRQLEEKCWEKIEKDGILVLTGMASCGKSLLAREISHRLVEEQKAATEVNARIQLDCSSKQTLENCLCAGPADLDKSSVSHAMEQLLGEFPENDRGIIIFDNITSSTAPIIEELLTEAPENAFIIGTTRDMHFLLKYQVRVGGMSIDEAYELSVKVMRDPLPEEQVHDLCDVLDNALGLIAAFKQMELTKTNIKDYIKSIKMKNDLDTPIVSMLQDIVAEMKQSAKPGEVRLLNAIACLDPGNIPIDNVSDVLTNQERTNSVMCLVKALTIRSLADVYTDTRTGKRFLNMRHIVLHAIYASMSGDEYQTALADALNFLSRYCSKDTRFLSNYERLIGLMPHIDSVLREVEKMKDSSSTRNTPVIIPIWLRLSLGHFHTHQKRPTMARKLLYYALDECEERLFWRVDFGVSDDDCIFQNICDDLKQCKTGKAESQEIDDFLCKQMVPEHTMKLWNKCKRRRSVDYEGEIIMSPSNFKKYSKEDCALPLDCVRDYFLLEFVASLLYTSGRMCFYLDDNKDAEVEKTPCKRHLKLAKRLSNHVELTYLRSHPNVSNDACLLYSELASRNGLLYFLLDKNTFENAQQAKFEYEQMLNNAIKAFEFGLLKTTETDGYRKLVICRQLIKACRIVLSLRCEENVHDLAVGYIEEQDKLIQQFEDDKEPVRGKASYWNESGLFYLECDNDTSNTKAKEYFLKACEAEQDSGRLNYPWFDAITGLAELFKKDETHFGVLLENLEKYDAFVNKVRIESPSEDHNKECKMVENLWKKLKEDPNFHRLLPENQDKISRTVRGIQRSFSHSGDTSLPLNEHADEEPDEVFIRGTSVQETTEPPPDPEEGALPVVINPISSNIERTAIEPRT